MDSYLAGEIASCISELNSIVNQLNGVSRDIDDSIKGMNTGAFVRGLEYSADKYRRAADKLRKIK